MMGTAFVRALRETLRCPSLPVVVALGTLLTLVGSSAAIGLWQIASLIAAMLVAGYCISYAREVALSDSPSLPIPREVGVFLRRGLGDFVIVFLAMLLLIPLLLVIGFATTNAPFAWSWVAPILGIAMLLLLLPAMARYAYTDQLREGIRFRQAIRQFWSTGAIALTPYLVLAASTTVQQLVMLAWRRTFDSPRIAWPQALGNVAESSAQASDVSLLVITLLLAALGFFVGLLMSHVLGQVAKAAFEEEGFEPVALTSASS